MKNNRLLYILIIFLTAWCAILSSELADVRNREDDTIINQYEVNGFSTDFTKIIEEARSAVVTINADGNILSGFVYKQENEDVYIISAYHGVSNVNSILVTFGASYTVNGELVGHDIFTDLAIIRIRTPYLIEALKLGDASLLKKGEFVICLGTPLSLDYQGSVEMGMVSAAPLQIENTIQVEEERYSYFLNMIQLNSDLLAGYSGSPLINMNGEVIGINTMSYNNSLVFSLTINEARIVADQLIANGSVERNTFGIKGTYLKDMYNYEKSDLNIALDTLDGIYVNRVRETGLAYAAGIRTGDVITTINGESISDLNSYLRAVYAPSEENSFEYIRNGEKVNAVIGND
ncbi:MAG: serine protease [Erysipelotrichaceae bacterium]|nr:serine protease [Erysipelotrichaceae bacterium]